MNTATITGHEPVIVREYVKGCPIRYERHPSGTYYKAGTPDAVRTVLESARVSERRIRLFYGDPSTPDWMEESDVIGYVFRTTGPLRIPIILRTRNAGGGPPILDTSIQRIICTRTHRELYRSPHYRVPIITPIHNPDGPDGLPWDATDPEGHVVARFADRGKAMRWCAFMRGERMCQ